MERSNRIDVILSMLEKEPNDIFLNYSLGLEYVSNNSFSLAEQQFKKVITIQSDYIPVYYQLGKLYELMKNNEEALRILNSGLNYAKTQKNNKAINEFGEAIFMLEE